MKLLFWFFTSLAAYGATLTVGTTCNGGACTYAPTQAGIQAAVDAAQYGDTITIEPETIVFSNTAGVILPPKSCATAVILPCDPWINIQTSLWSELKTRRPRGQRVHRDYFYFPNEEDADLMPKLQAFSGGTVFNGSTWVDAAVVDAAANTLTVAGFADGDAINVAGSSMGVFICNADNDPNPYCDPGDEGYIRDKNTTTFPNGTPMYMYASGYDGNIPQEGWYFIVDSTGTSKYHISATLGGQALTHTSASADYMLNAEFLPYPLRSERIYYVVNSSGNTFQLSTVPCASPCANVIDITSGGYHLLNTNTFTANRVLVGKAQNVSGWRFRGLEVSQQPYSTYSYYLFLFGNINNYTTISRWQIPNGFEFDHVYAHGWPWQDGPKNALRSGGNTVVRDSVMTDAKAIAASSQSQAIYPTCNTGEFHLINSVISGQGESFMSDIAGCYIRDMPMKRLHFKDNFIHRPNRWYPGMRVNRDSSTVLRVKTTAASPLDCLTAYNGGDSAPSSRCVSYLEDERRYEIVVDTYVTFTTAASGNWVMLHLWGGTFELRHNINSGTVVCTGSMTCTYDASLNNTAASWPAKAKGITKGTITSGSLDTISVSSVNNVFVYSDTRNLLETKTGTHFTIEGNLFRGSWFMSGFDGGIQLNPKLGASNDYDANRWWSKTQHTLITNNYFLDGTNFVAASGDAPTVGKEDTWRFKLSDRHQIINNIAVKMGGWYWGRANSASQTSNRPFFTSGSGYWRMKHNTIIDVDQYSMVWVSAAASYVDRTTYGHDMTDNIFVARTRNNLADGYHATAWESLVFPGMVGDGDTDMVGSSSLTQDNADPGYSWFRESIFTRNVITNPTVTNKTARYQAGNYLLTAGTSATDLHANFLTNGYRIPTGDYSAGGANAPEGQLGADPDIIDAKVGPLGVDARDGVSSYAQRSWRSFTTTATTMTVSYKQITAAATCTITAYDNQYYVTNGGTVTVTDTAFPLLAYHDTKLTGLVSNTKYYVKRVCGTNVDVFEARTQ